MDPNLTLKTGKKHYFYDLYEIAFFSVETNSSNQRVEPGVHVKKGTYIHHTSGSILPNRDNHPLAIYVVQDSIEIYMAASEAALLLRTSQKPIFESTEGNHFVFSR